MKKTGIVVLVLTVLLLILASASNETKTAADESEKDLPETRGFHMGFTTFPYAISLEAVQKTRASVLEHSDIVLVHLDRGVPWQQVYETSGLPPYVIENLQQYKGFPEHRLFLTVTVTQFDRQSLTGSWTESSEQDLQVPFWQNRSFDDPLILQTYIAYCKLLIDFLEPDYFAFAIEANATFRSGTGNFNSYLKFAEVVYGSLKSSYPNLPIMQTVQDQAHNIPKEELFSNTSQILQFSDYVAVSTYPFWVYDFPMDRADPDFIRQFMDDSWLYEIRDLAPEKPFAVSETGYIAETLIIEEVQLYLEGSEEWQTKYTGLLLERLYDMEAEFGIWFVHRDYDMLYDTFPDPPFYFLIWKDTGMIDGVGNPRPALSLWDQWLSIPVN